MKKFAVFVIALNMNILLLFGSISLAALNDGLLAYYPFNANANDETGYGHDGMVYGATLTEDRFGDPNRAYLFDGINNYIEVPPIEPTTFSLSVWIKTTYCPSYIFSTDPEAFNCNHGYRLRIGEDGHAVFLVDESGACKDTSMIYSDILVDDGNWHHIVAIYDYSLKLYVDGLLQSDTLDSNYSKTGQPLRIGMTRSWDPPLRCLFLGKIDDILIYNRALSEPEVKALYNLTNIKMDLTAGWHMISLPVNPIDKKLNAVFPEAVVAYGYEQGTGYVRVKSNEDLEVGKGYWILLDQETSYPLTGIPIQSHSYMPYDDGWAMIGGCTSSAKASVVNGTIGVIYGYEQGGGYQQVTDHFEPGKGYWILLNNVTGGAIFSVETVD